MIIFRIGFLTIGVTHVRYMIILQEIVINTIETVEEAILGKNLLKGSLTIKDPT